MSLIGKDRKLGLACELAADRIVAARATKGEIDVSAVRTLNSGAIAPNLTTANITDRDAVKRAVQEAMSGVQGSMRDVIAVIPDGACRLALLDFDNLPEKRDEAEAIIRFRMKKSVPFEIERARVSFHVQVGDKGSLSVLAAVMLSSVLNEYESVLREAGYTPGMVIPSMLAALGQVDATVPTLVIKVERFTTSLAVLDRGRLVLLRTLENPAGTPPEAAQLAEDAYPSLVFYEDTFGSKVQKILLNGVTQIDQFSAAMEDQTGLRAQELVSVTRVAATTGAQRSALGAVAGILASQQQADN